MVQRRRQYKSTTGIGAGRPRSSRTWRNRRLQKPPRPEQKQPLRGGAERRLNRNQRKPLRTAADPGKLNERAATLQEKRSLSRYGEWYKGKRGETGGAGKRARKEKKRGTRHREHYEERKTKGDTARGALRRKEKKGDTTRGALQERGGKGAMTGNTGKKQSKQKSDKRQQRQS
ncbi:hypothetical protein NDU88_007560 [Pleurodeles waltl]|uniref:Uncharacterized protein n=1 Tax=Pleurodeles waltl TaxID=8319 RepID=A0AAV7PPR1_PLEWA|nr:hypothetical protein NDU88_007560 [Pleurodeles waltl]